MPKVVPIGDLKPTTDRGYGQRRMKSILATQGQISPIQVNAEMEIQDNAENPYSNDYYWAAKALDWKDLMVTDGKY